MDVGYQSHDLLPLPRAIAASSPSPSFSSASASTSTSATRAAAAAAAALPPLPFPLFPAVRVSFVHFLRRRVRVSFFADANILDYRENSRIFRPKKVFPRFSSSILINLFFFVLSRRNFFSSKSIINNNDNDRVRFWKVRKVDWRHSFFLFSVVARNKLAPGVGGNRARC